MKTLVVVASTASVVVACSSPRLVVPQPGQPGTTPAAHQVSHDRDGVVDAELDVVSGATTINVAIGNTGGKLFQAITPPGSGQLPEAVVTDGHVQLSLMTIGSQAASALSVVLDPDVVWTVQVDGGATSDVVDAKAGKLAGVTIAAGATSVELTLPAPSTTTVVHETAGASQFVVHAAGTFPAQVRFGGGAGSAMIDGVSHSGIGGGTSFTPGGWAAARVRYDIEMDAGVSSFTLDRSS